MTVAQTGFDGDGEVCVLHQRGGDSKHLRYVLQDAGTCSFAGYFAYGAAPIDVDEVGLGFFHHIEASQQLVLVGPKYLYANGSLLFGEAHLAQALLGVAVESFGSDKFGNEQVGAEFLTELTERQVGDIVHRREAD